MRQIHIGNIWILWKCNKVSTYSHVQKWTMAKFLFVCDSRNYNWPGVVCKGKGHRLRFNQKVSNKACL